MDGVITISDMVTTEILATLHMNPVDIEIFCPTFDYPHAPSLYLSLFNETVEYNLFTFEIKRRLPRPNWNYGLHIHYGSNLETSFVFVGARDGNIHMYGMMGDTPIRKFDNGHISEVRYILTYTPPSNNHFFSTSTPRMISASSDNKIIIWNMESAEQ